MRSNCWIFSLHTGNSGSIVQQIKTQFLPVNYRAVLTKLVRIKIHSNTTIPSVHRRDTEQSSLTRPNTKLSTFHQLGVRPSQAGLVENKPTSQWWQIFGREGGREGGRTDKGPTFSHSALVLISYQKNISQIRPIKNQTPSKNNCSHTTLLFLLIFLIIKYCYFLWRIMIHHHR